MTEGSETQTAFRGLTASGQDAAHRSCSRDMPRVVRKDIDVARRAAGGLQRSDITCDDLSLQIFADEGGREGRAMTHLAALVQVLIQGDICWGSLSINGCPVEGLSRGKFCKIISAVG